MNNYRPQIDNPISLILLIPTHSNSKGVSKKIYPTIEQAMQIESSLFFGSFKSYGGTERDVNGVYSIEDTAVVKTWFRPDIKSDCRIAVPQTGAIYEILNEPENINMRNQFLNFKVKRIKGNV